MRRAPAPSAKGDTCQVGGIAFPSGAEFSDLRDCNTCTCSGGREELALICTQMLCPWLKQACIVNDVTYPDGSTNVPDPASCNSCSCVRGEVTHCSTQQCPLAPACDFGVKHYQSGQGFVTKDGGFACTCNGGKFKCGVAKRGAKVVPAESNKSQP